MRCRLRGIRNRARPRERRGGERRGDVQLRATISAFRVQLVFFDPCESHTHRAVATPRRPLRRRLRRRARDDDVLRRPRAPPLEVPRRALRARRVHRPGRAPLLELRPPPRATRHAGARGEKKKAKKKRPSAGRRRRRKRKADDDAASPAKKKPTGHAPRLSRPLLSWHPRRPRPLEGLSDPLTDPQWWCVLKRLTQPYDLDTVLARTAQRAAGRKSASQCASDSASRAAQHADVRGRRTSVAPQHLPHRLRRRLERGALGGAVAAEDGRRCAAPPRLTARAPPHQTRAAGCWPTSCHTASKNCSKIGRPSRQARAARRASRSSGQTRATPSRPARRAAQTADGDHKAASRAGELRRAPAVDSGGRPGALAGEQPRRVRRAAEQRRLEVEPAAHRAAAAAATAAKAAHTAWMLGIAQKCTGRVEP